MSLRHALLGMLAEGPYTGWGLLKSFKGSLGYAWPALHSQIYPELARLREAGLIEQVGEGPRGSKTYEATEAGRAQVTRWLRETEPDRGTRNDPLLRIFFLWLLDDDDAEQWLAREEAYLRDLLEELDAIVTDEPPPATRKEHAFRLALEWGRATTRARIEWARSAQADVHTWPDP
jgi:PadR family transcriptional regulator, regulatory protein AphA